MSGGHFDYRTVPDALLGAWRDEEVNAIVRDLFDGGEFSVRGYGVKVSGSIEELREGPGEDGPTDCLGSWVTDLDARQDLEDAARDLALRRAREHLEYVEERERREAEREKTDEA